MSSVQPTSTPPGRDDSRPYVSVVVPVYQERDAIGDVVEEIVRVFQGQERSFEVVVVDDGSTDGTTRVLDRIAADYPGIVQVINQPYNKGNGATVRTGMRAARGELIACMDADGQHDPAELLRLLPRMVDYDLVVGARTLAKGGDRHRNLGDKFYSKLASWIAQFPITDLTSGMRVFQAEEVLPYVHLFPQRFSYPTTSTLAFIKAGHNVAFVPINIRRRRTGASKIKLLRDAIRFLIIIVKIIVIFDPLRVFFPTAIMLFLLASAATGYSIWSLERLFIPNGAVVLYVVSVLVVLLGLIAEQVAALQVSSRDEPRR